MYEYRGNDGKWTRRALDSREALISMDARALGCKVFSIL